MTKKQRSGCPVSLGLDVFGDRWTLLIIRDLMFSGKRNFRELIQSEEGIRLFFNVMSGGRGPNGEVGTVGAVGGVGGGRARVYMIQVCLCGM